MKTLKPRERAFWKEYLATLPAKSRPKKPFVTAGYAGGRNGTDALVRLHRAGPTVSGNS